MANSHFDFFELAFHGIWSINTPTQFSAKSCYCGGAWEASNHLGSCIEDTNPKVLVIPKDQCDFLIDYKTYTLSYGDRYHTIKNISVNDDFYYSKVIKGHYDK